MENHVQQVSGSIKETLRDMLADFKLHIVFLN